MGEEKVPICARCAYQLECEGLKSAEDDCDEFKDQFDALDEDLVCEEFACPKCGERRMDYLANDENHITCFAVVSTTS